MSQEGKELFEKISNDAWNKFESETGMKKVRLSRSERASINMGIALGINSAFDHLGLLKKDTDAQAL